MEIDAIPYIVLLKETEVSDDSKPHKHGRGPKKYATDIITRQTLKHNAK